MRFVQYIAILSLGLLSLAPETNATVNCNTVLSRIAKKEADNFMKSKGEIVCSGLKKGDIRIDKTREFTLRSFNVCENGNIASAEAEVFIRCATSDRAFIQASVSDTISAKVVANLKTCKIEEATIHARKFFVKIGIAMTDIEKKLKDRAFKNIKKYCD